jgi:hypothetical protein
MVLKSALPASWDLPAEFRERVGEKVGRQRAMIADGHLLLVLHRVPTSDESERRGRFLWRKPEGQWQSSDFGPGAGALGKHLTEYSEVIEEFDEQERQAGSVAAYQSVLEGMAPIYRTVRNLHAALQDARQSMPDDRDLINARDRAYELERSAELLVGEVRNSIQFSIARKAEEQADTAHQMAVSAHRLNLLAAFFFPIAALTAIFGTNLTHPLEQYVPPPYAFFLVIGAGFVLGLLLAGQLAGSAAPRNSSSRGADLPS